MAQVTLQAVVNFEQVNQLQQRIDKLNGTKVTIGVKDFTRQMQEAGTATGKVNESLSKVVRVFDANGELLSGVEKYQKGIGTTVEIMQKMNKETEQLEETGSRVIRDLTKEQKAAAKAAKEHADYVAECNREYEKYQQYLASQQKNTPIQNRIDALTGVYRDDPVTRKEFTDFGRLLIKQEEQAAKAAEKAAAAQKKEEEATADANKEVKKQGLLYDILGRNVSSFVARMVAYRAVYAGIRAITNGFREALQTLKAVDDELVTVRKVTGFDEYQMARVEEQAYAVASRYGTSASDYTSSVAAFARAGYKDLSGDLAELAEKTKIVGDTTADVAQQFLLSVDAAYKYKGNIEALTAVLDGANEIDNKYATSIEKIAEGMGIVAPVAAQMNVGVDELAASIGTITAVTQRTGTEAARALRAIYLNIVGDTKTEIEEGVTWTTGEIEGLRDVIKLYAKDAWDAAQASGGIIDPMEAIAGLSKSVKDGVLTEAQLMEMVSDIGGKLRTSQLLALINNWDMYESMLADYNNAYGSAEKEIENAMDSWTRKSEVLKNTWTQFVKTGLNSEAFKGFLDILTGIVQRLGTLPGLITRLGLIIGGFNFTKLSTGIGKIASKITGVVTALKTGTMTASAFGGALGVIGIALSAVTFIVESFKRAEEEARQAAQDAIQTTQDDIKTLNDLRNKYIEIIDSTADEATKDQELSKFKQELIDVYGFEKDAVEAVNKERQTGIDLINAEAEAALRKTISENQDTFEKAAEHYRGSRSAVGEFGTGAISDELIAELEAAGAVFAYGDAGFSKLTVEGKNLRDTMENLASVIDVIEKKQLSRNGLTREEENLLEKLRKQYNDLETEMEQWGSIYENQIDLMAQYNLMMEGVSDKTFDSKDAFDGLKRTLKETYGDDADVWAAMEKRLNEMFPEFQEAIEQETVALKENAEALEEDATAAEKAAAAKKEAEAAVHAHIGALIDETGKLTEAGAAAFAASSYLADLANAELNARYEAAQANYARLRAELAAVSTEALKAAYAMIAYMEAAQDGILDPEAWKARQTGGYAYSLMAQIEAIQREMDSISVGMSSVAPYTSSYSGGGSYGGGSSSSSATAEVDEYLKALQDRISLLKSELSLMKERGDSEEDQIAKMRELMEALESERQYLISIGAEQATINGLEEEWWRYQNQITAMQEQAADAAEREAEAVQAVLDATVALANAERQRSVRVYNASTGQWEWTANPSAVASAQQAYDSAFSGLTDEQREAFQAWIEAGQNIHIPGHRQDYVPANAGTPLLPSIFNRIRNGATYNMGGVTISEAQAKSMSVYDFAQLSGSLAAYNRSV